MASTSKHKPKPSSTARRTRARKPSANVLPDVLTLREAAAFLRVADREIEALAESQTIPCRKLGNQWRFLRSALEDWLRQPVVIPSKEAMLACAGSWKDDPTVQPMLDEIYRRRGRPMVQSD